MLMLKGEGKGVVKHKVGLYGMGQSEPHEEAVHLSHCSDWPHSMQCAYLIETQFFQSW